MPRSGRRRSRAQESIQGRTDHRHPEGVGGGREPGELCRRHGITRGSLYRWKAKYGGMDVSEARRLRALEEENRQLKHIVAEQAAGGPFKPSFGLSGAVARFDGDSYTDGKTATPRAPLR